MSSGPQGPIFYIRCKKKLEFHSRKQPNRLSLLTSLQVSTAHNNDNTVQSLPSSIENLEQSNISNTLQSRDGGKVNIGQIPYSPRVFITRYKFKEFYILL